MYVALFYYSLLILLACGITTAINLSAYFVTRRRADLYLVACYLFYFLDAAIVYENDFVANSGAYNNDAFFFIGHPVLSAITGAGAFGCLWLFCCERLDVKSRPFRFVPIALLLVMPLVFYGTVADIRLREFLYFISREVFMAFLLTYIAFRHAAADEATRLRVRKLRPVFWAVTSLTALTALENVVFQLLFDPMRLNPGILWFFAERNISENLLFMTIATFTIRAASHTLAIRFDQPPTRESEGLQQSIDAKMPRFAKTHGLSKREQEIARLVILGKDNQNIASELSLALSTVKVHVHNILRKCDQPNRQELTKAFWRE